ncbi:YpbS family protein [Metabacillus sp. RGM 3146]|uniref:YpbS family protein n=1 Tax=Metabacillus sp. RGM 3146 TaxID=3401092 RepID=UPI003B9D95D3
MAEVHKAISEHSKKQNRIIQTFAALDAKREQYIEEALGLCQEGKPFTVNRINQVTEEINQLAKKGIVPLRKHVTDEMVKEYANRRAFK